MINQYFEKKLEVRSDMIVIKINKEELAETILTLRDKPDFGFKQLVDIVCIDDNPAKNNKNQKGNQARFRILYLLLNLKNHTRIAIEIAADESEGIPSVVRFFPNANWHEREVFDMFGISFEGHPDLRRILTDYMFEGYPLRKDFPLTGYYETKYDPASEKVIYQKVKLSQEFRFFETEGPWVGVPKDMAIDDGSNGNKES